MPEVALRQSSLYPYLTIGDSADNQNALSVDIPRGPVAVYETAMRALLIAELDVLRAAKDQLLDIHATTPKANDRLGRNRRARAGQLIDRMDHLEREVG